MISKDKILKKQEKKILIDGKQEMNDELFLYYVNENKKYKNLIKKLNQTQVQDLPLQ